MELFTYWRSSAAFRVRIVLNLKGVDYQSRSVDLRIGEQSSDTYLATNPQGLVPTLVDGDTSLTQSLAILEYLEETHPQPPLLPAPVAERAAVRAFCLAVACDMPFVSEGVFAALLEARAPDVEAVVARTPDGRRHPLCACYHQNTRPIVEAHLAAGTLAMHALLDRLKNVRYVDLPEAPLTNVNTLSDLEGRASV